MKNQVIYQIFPRNHSKEGTLKAIENDLKRIKELGTTIIYLMPIHEIGKTNRKGKFGSPYSIKDYYSVSKDLGSLNDFKSLVNKTHELGMKIIMDMVFNHTSIDNPLALTHDEYYFHKEDGKRGNRVGDWTDIMDLDTYRNDVQEYLIDVLKYWAGQGVDGFRFDVCSLISLDFFIKARKELGQSYIFFGETIDDGFVSYCNELNIRVTPDKNYEGIFDIIYNYNWYRPLENYLKGYGSFENVISAIESDSIKDSKSLCRANALENHDTERIASLVESENQLLELMNFAYKLEGNIFIYAGQEYGISHRPNLFEKDPIDWSNKNLTIYGELVRLIQKHKKNL